MPVIAAKQIIRYHLIIHIPLQQLHVGTQRLTNIPVMLKFYVIPELSIDFGPQLGVNVYSKMTQEWEVLDVKYKDTDDLKDETKTVDFGLGLGLTYNIAKDVFVQGRYTLGLTKVFEYGNDKNGNAQIAIGYRF